MNDLIPFDFNGATIRAVIGDDGEPLFVARDIAVALAYTNPSKAVGDHCKGVTKRDLPTAGGIQSSSVIPERDVYRLIMRSKLPAAERFEEWVVGEVLPSIRKTGAYNPVPAIDLNDPEFLRSTLLQYTEKVIELQTTIAEQAPAVEFAHAVRNTEDAISIGDMARLLGTGQNRLFRRLRDDHILMPACTRPYQHFIDRGYFRVIENVWFDAAKEAHPTFKTLVTGRGQVYLQRKYATEVAA